MAVDSDSKGPFIATQLNWTQLTKLNSVQPSQSCFCLWRHDLQTESTGSLRSLIGDSCSPCERVDNSTSSWVELCRYKRALRSFFAVYVTCEICCGIDCSWPELWVRPSSWTWQRRSEAPHHSIPAELHETSTFYGSNAVLMPKTVSVNQRNHALEVFSKLVETQTFEF